MEEFILSFLPEQFAYPDIFRIKLAGITYLFASYHVKRQHSRIYSLEYLISGKSEIRIDETAYFPSKGDVYILPRDRDHHYWSDKKDPMTSCVSMSQAASVIIYFKSINCIRPVSFSKSLFNLSLMN